MENNLSQNKKLIALSVIAVSLFALASLGARSINPAGQQGASLTGANDPAISTVEQSGFEASLKSFSSTLYAWTSRNPEEKTY